MEFGTCVVGVAAGDLGNGVLEVTVPAWVAVGPGCSYARCAASDVGIRDVGVGGVDAVFEKVEVEAAEIVSGVFTSTTDVVENAGRVSVGLTIGLRTWRGTWRTAA